MSDLMICLVVALGGVGVFILVPLLLSKLFVLLWGKSKEEPIAYKSSEQLLEESRAIMTDTTIPLSTSQTDDKPASATKRAVVGTIIGGVPGAIIGVASAIDKNNKNK